ncbi:MAG: hypothetical protein BGO31_05780 [Bacteroidetes bacterium 43-16]|nr:MAG: hypothetical protein BGO31_05780 [Bacteroidetes bacterium 43-16]
MTKVGSNIKKIRATKGLSQQAFADIFELTRGNISSYEENRADPKIEIIVKIANYFSIPLEALITQHLTVNQILNFKGDKLMEEEKTLDALQLKEVPYINDNIYAQCRHGHISFSDHHLFPKLVLPSTGNINLLALTFNSNIPHPSALPRFGEHDILVFEALTETNFHLCEHTPGLYIGEKELMLGYYQSENESMKLVLNALKEHVFDIKSGQQFWKLYASYQHLP